VFGVMPRLGDGLAAWHALLFTVSAHHELFQEPGYRRGTGIDSVNVQIDRTPYWHMSEVSNDARP